MSVFVDAITGARVPVIAEVKLRDAEGTDLLGGRPVAEVVTAYREAGAACLSVVTGKWFGGTTELLREVASLIDVPLLQKDFITTKTQLQQAADLGASAVLLTAGLLPATMLPRLAERALELGLTPFVEVTTADEIPVNAHECVIAVNNKDIKHRERRPADLDRGFGLLPAVLASGTPCAVSASGIDTPETGARLIDAGFGALLVGTGLLRSGSPAGWFTRFEQARTNA